MPFRNEEESLRARVQRLEGELAEAHETIARLEGKRAAHDALAEEPSRLAGIPSAIRMQRELSFEMTERGYEAVAELMRQRSGPSNVSQVGRTLTYSFQGLEMRVLRTDLNKTRVELSQSYGSVGVGVSILTALGTVLASVPVALILEGTGQSPGVFVAALPFLLLLSYMLTRRLLKGRVATDRVKLAGLLESVTEVAKQHAQPVAPSGRVRVGLESSEERRVEEERIEEDVATPGAQAAKEQ